jgi:hypothetical protein
MAFQSVTNIAHYCDGGHFDRRLPALRLTQRSSMEFEENGAAAMIAALAAIKYLGGITDRFFEARMQNAAVKISLRSRRFPR